MNAFSEDIARLLRSRLGYLGIMKKDFAEMMGVSPSVVTRWLSGNANLELRTICKMEAVLDCQIIYVPASSPCFECIVPEWLVLKVKI